MIAAIRAFWRAAQLEYWRGKLVENSQARIHAIEQAESLHAHLNVQERKINNRIAMLEKN